MKKNELLNEFVCNHRTIDILTLDTSLKKIIVVSTIFTKNSGEIAIQQIEALNHSHILSKLDENNWKIIERFDNPKEMYRFKEKYIKELHWQDFEKCEESE